MLQQYCLLWLVFCASVVNCFNSDISLGLRKFAIEENKYVDDFPYNPRMKYVRDLPPLFISNSLDTQSFQY